MNPRSHCTCNLSFKRWISTALVLVAVMLSPLESRGQKDSSAKRRVVSHPSAPYPVLARTMALTGVVKVDAIVAPDGTVKTVDVRGGHPVLAQAAANTIRQWKWEPAAHESHEQIEIRFSPPE